MSSGYQALARALLDGGEAWRITTLTGAALGTVTQHITPADGTAAVFVDGWTPETGQPPCLVQAHGEEQLLERLTAQKVLLICGGGHVSVPVAQLGQLLGYRVLVCDDRPEFADPVRFPQADEVTCMDFAALADSPVWTECADLSVVIVTRGHAADLVCLREALRHPTAYVGMIGSQRKNAAVFDRLRAEGVPDAALARVHAPIGLAIGAETPEEIAVSIAAELIETRRTCANSSLSQGMLRALADGCGGVMATVVRKRGSAPRGLGARLLVTAAGHVLGTVGGGLAEGEVIAAARAMLDAPRVEIRHFDMNNGQAGTSGLICGGAIDVLFEGVD